MMDNITLFNSQGKKVKSQANRSVEAEINIADLTRGMYLLVVKSGKKTIVRKVIKS